MPLSTDDNRKAVAGEVPKEGNPPVQGDTKASTAKLDNELESGGSGFASIGAPSAFSTMLMVRFIILDLVPRAKCLRVGCCRALDPMSAGTG
jgi:hypothetical protein